MPMPDFQSMMLPTLRMLGDRESRPNRQVVEELAIEFCLTAEERFGTVNKNGRPKFDNRVEWTITHLFKAGLVERSSRGKVRITGQGSDALADAETGSHINIKYLNQFPEYRAFRARSSDRHSDNALKAEETNNYVETVADPVELLEASSLSLRAALVDDLVLRIKQQSPQFFERLVLDLLVAMGYGGSRQDAAQAVGRSGDGGIDGIIKEDRLGLDSIYLQAKRWESVVGRSPVAEFAGSLDGHRARKGVFITTSRFSSEARKFAGSIEKRIVLIDGEQLANLMIDHGVGVADVAIYTIKRIDEDYFEEN